MEMSTMPISTPAFIFNTLQQELQKIHLTWLEQIAQKYNLPLEELKQEFIKDLKIIPETTEKIYICKKYKARKIPMEEDRCKALIWNKGKGGQCTRPCCDGEEYCKIHVMHLKYGSVDKPKELCVVPRTVYG